MLHFTYNLLIFLYKGIITFASLFHKKARSKIKGVQDSQKITAALQENSNLNNVLIHCSSQGEHEQAIPLIRWILKNTDFNIVLSFFSPSGFIHSKYDETPRVIKVYLPFDTPGAMSKFLKSVRPILTLIIKNEWWWNLLYTLKVQKIPTYLVSATIRKEHYFVKYPLRFFREGLAVFDKVFVIDQASKKNITQKYNLDVITAGDTRIDQANNSKAIIEKRSDYSNTKTSSKKHHTIVYGSIWENDLNSINTLISLYPDFRHLIYPHDLSERNIKNLKRGIKSSFLFSNTDMADKKVNIITSMGELKYAYNLASLAYIGGGFGAGIHNILEAAVYLIPTIFGPNHHKSNEAINLVQTQCAFSFTKTTEIQQICTEINEEKNRNEIETKLKSYFSPEHSPTEIICQEIFKKIDINV